MADRAQAHNNAMSLSQYRQIRGRKNRRTVFVDHPFSKLESDRLTALVMERADKVLWKTGTKHSSAATGCCKQSWIDIAAILNQEFPLQNSQHGRTVEVIRRRWAYQKAKMEGKPYTLKEHRRVRNGAAARAKKRAVHQNRVPHSFSTDANSSSIFPQSNTDYAAFPPAFDSLHSHPAQHQSLLEHINQSIPLETYVQSVSTHHDHDHSTPNSTGHHSTHGGIKVEPEPECIHIDSSPVPVKSQNVDQETRPMTTKASTQDTNMGIMSNGTDCNPSTQPSAPTYDQNVNTPFLPPAVQVDERLTAMWMRVLDRQMDLQDRQHRLMDKQELLVDKMLRVDWHRCFQPSFNTTNTNGPAPSASSAHQVMQAMRVAVTNTSMPAHNHSGPLPF